MATGLYAIYKQPHPPTGIEMCVYCNFMSSREQNLVIAGTSQLHVYRLIGDGESATSKGTDKSDIKSKKQKLECFASYSLFGNITSMQKVRLAGASRDGLLLSFADAKLSLIEYDPSSHDLKNTSLHYFQDESLKDGIEQNLHIPIVRVDTENRCAVMLIYGSRLVVLPFRRDIITEEQSFLTGNKTQIMSSFVIDLRHLDEKITNVIDFQFLHGYYEPTLFILYEPVRTWAGRVAVRKDTCNIVAISLNIPSKVYPIVWSMQNLPFDCIQVLAVQKPIGGVLVLAVNSLFYLNQSVPPYGVSLNSITQHSTDFILKEQQGVKISLDCAQAAFIDTDRLVLSLKGGELYVLTMMVDGMRAVRSFNFDKSAASVLTTCCCACDDNYLFLGSRLGNSLLLKYTQKDDLAPDDVSAPLAKKIKLEKDLDEDKLDDLELEVYGTDNTQPGTEINSYTFEVCDSIMNIGPCGQMVMGEPAFLSEEFSNTKDPDVELVTTSGHGKNGALSVLQRSIRPQVVTTFELPGCTDMWTVIGQPNSDEVVEVTDGSKSDDDSHAFLILSREDSTMILQTGQEIMELENSGFNTISPTIFAGNLGNNKYILQVSPSEVRLLQGAEEIHKVELEAGTQVKHCSIADPYTLLLTETGELVMLELREESSGSEVKLSLLHPNIDQSSKSSSICTYKDLSGMFTSKLEMEEVTKTSESKTPKSSFLDTGNFSFNQSTVDDEDELLYGDSTGDIFGDTTKTEEEKEMPSSESATKKVEPTFWAIVGKENGKLEIYSMPEFKLSYCVRDFPVGNKVLTDNTTDLGQSRTGMEKSHSDLPVVKELMIVGMGYKQTRPYIMAIVGDELYIYEAFPYNGAPELDTSHLKLRFHRVSHGLLIRERKQGMTKKKGEDDEEEKEQGKYLRQFTDVSGYNGVFVSGPCPYWLIMTTRGSLRCHPMSIDGWITCFAPFHNVNCPKGFLYFNRQDELRISVLPTHLSYDAPWPVRKVPLRCTPHYIQYHQETKIYAVVTSTSELCNKICRIRDDEKEYEHIERDDRYIYPTLEKYSMQLFSPVSWEVIPNTKIETDEWETIICLGIVYLTSQGTISGLHGYLAFGTNYSYGEEVASRGRMFLYDIIEVVPEPGKPLTKNKLKMIYDKEQKGPVTAVASVDGDLVAAIGQKIYIFQLKDDDLSAVAFIDTNVYIHSIQVIHNILLVADIIKSVCVLRYQSDMKVLSIVSRDIKPMEVFGIEFLVDNTQLGFVVADKLKNLMIFTYSPEARESHGGQRLVRKADINIGSNMNTMFRLRCKITDPSTSKRASGVVEKKHVTFMASLDGSIGYVLPIKEAVYRRLLMLQNSLNINLQHIAGLNPKAFRSYKQSHKTLSNPQKCILDGELVWNFLNLSVNERNEINKKLGTTTDQLLDDLTEIDRITAHF